MSSGRPDYYTRVAPVPEWLGDDEAEHIYNGTAALAGSASGTIYTYNAPATQDLYIVMLIISCSMPGTMYFDVKNAGTFVFTTYFDTIFNFHPFGGIAFKVTAGNNFLIQAKNTDTVENSFKVSVRGYLKDI